MNLARCMESVEPAHFWYRNLCRSAARTHIGMSNGLFVRKGQEHAEESYALASASVVNDNGDGLGAPQADAAYALAAASGPANQEPDTEASYALAAATATPANNEGGAGCQYGVLER